MKLSVVKAQTRMVWLDIAKAGGIILIVFGHLVADDFVKKILWTFHVPLFFFLSGYLNRPSDVPAFARRLVLRLIVPYISGYVLLTLIVLRTLDWHTLAPVLRGMFYGSHSYPQFISAPLWFLPSLVTVELLVFVMSRTSWAIYPVLLGMSLWLFHHGRVNEFMSVDLSLLGINYFVLGMLARSTGVLQRLQAAPMAGALVAGAGLALVADLALAGNVWYAGPFYTRALLGGAAGIAMTVALAQGVQRSALLNNRLVRFISCHTLFILCFHGVSNNYAVYWLGLAGMNVTTTSAYAVAAAMSVAMLLPFAWMFERWAPWVIGAPCRPRPDAGKAAVAEMAAG